MSIKRVAVLGGTGNLGPSVVNQLLAANFDVTVLSRSSSLPSTINSGAKVAQVDYSSQSSLTQAFQGHDAFVSITGNPGFDSQPGYIDAALAAGVKYILPSEFGCDLSNPHNAQLPVFGHKLTVRKHLEQLAADGKLSYTYIEVGAFLDWGIENGFIVNLAGTTQLWNGGDVKFSATTLADTGRAVAGVLKSPEQYKNRQVLVNSAVVTQKQLLAAAEKATGKQYATEPANVEDRVKQSYETLKTGQGDIGYAMIGFLMGAMFTPENGNAFQKTESEALGIKVLDERGVEELVAKLAK